MKAVLAAIASLASVSASPASGPSLRTSITVAVPSPFTASFHYVPRMDCGTTRGSAVRISDDVLITAHHVVDKAPCSAFGEVTKVTYRDPRRDFAAVTAKLGSGYRAIVSCDGILEGRRYIAMGYPDGEAPALEPLVGTDDHVNGMAILRGRAYPGMSGGAVVDTDLGAIVAILNAAPRNGKPLVYVTALKDTYLCQA